VLPFVTVGALPVAPVTRTAIGAGPVTETRMSLTAPS
jgi:hypothetical protein